jgi:uncharacterized protein YbgA (DUF1722 family)/uncharacterized protein YbbK (DUF523 family)
VNDFPKPKLYCSKCLGFCACWWNGQIQHSDFVENITPYVEFLTHCPEVEIGLGAPRKWLRIILVDGVKKFVQPATKIDFSSKMIEYIEETVPTLKGLDGFILRKNSPSCSIGNVRYYQSMEKGSQVLSSEPGLFGGAVINTYGDLPIESDGRLNNQRIRESFLTKIFTLASFREVMQLKKMNSLVKFHSANKYLFMTFNQQKLRELGRIVANREKKSIESILEDYSMGLRELISGNPRSSNVVNVFSKIFRYFSKELSSGETKHFLQQLDAYRMGKASVTSLREMLKLWSIRFNEDYILDQTVFQPFPEGLNMICEATKYRNKSRRK